MMPQQPSALFGSLFKAVQEGGLFPDSKTFADAIPRRSTEDIMAAWDRLVTTGAAANDALIDFVRENFIVPHSPELTAPQPGPLRDYILTLWPALTRPPEAVTPGASLLPLLQPYVVPGGRFRELYYWDSYFTMLGLAASGRQDLVEAMVANFGSLIERYGHIPNGTRSYYLSRSQPPVFYLMAALSQDRTDEARRARLRLIQAEHGFWMAGEETLTSSGEHRRVVRLADGALLNRYWDDNAAPRDESWREDIELAQLAPERDAGELWRDIRAAAESGWDFSSRWLGDRQSLATIRTTRLLPIDLNALLFGMEHMIATEAAELGEPMVAAEFSARAEARRDAIDRHLWNEDGAFFADFDLDVGKVSDLPTAAQGFALFTRAIRAERAGPTARSLASLLRAGGLVTTANETGQQWDAPNGWAPLQWAAIQGLRHYGEDDLAQTIGQRGLAMVEQHYRATGQLLEKYDVVACGAGGGGEYGVEIGFGWTNGVTLELIDRRA